MLVSHPQVRKYTDQWEYLSTTTSVDFLQACILLPYFSESIFISTEEIAMPRGDKSSYTSKQKRQAEHVEEGYEKRGVSPREAQRRAWATVNKSDGGGKKSGSGRGKARNSSSRSDSARKAAQTRQRNASH
jgi:plasmid stabilization system protein ParE